MEEVNDKLQQKIDFLPDLPGVYMMKNRNGDVIYAGKALNLRNRVRSYFTNRFDEADSYQAKLIKLVEQVTDIEYIVTSDESEAFLLEANIIKEYKPRYNVTLKDDKRYPFIKITVNEPFPRLMIDREKRKDGSKYFGPYSDSSVLRRTIRVMEWILPIRTCKRNIPAGKPVWKKSCLNYQLGKCCAPCIGAISQADYRKMIRNLMAFLTGKNSDIIASLTKDMHQKSENLEFENAAKIRDQITAIEKVQKAQHMYFLDEEDRDVITYYREESIVVVAVLKILGGKLLNQEFYRLANAAENEPSEILSAFIKQYYVDKLDSLPSIIMISEEPEDFESLNLWLKKRIIIPQRGDNKKLLSIARKNAFNHVEAIKLSHIRKTSRTVYPVQELKEKLNLPKLPRKMACLDISTIQGSDTVAAVVYFENGKPLKKGYRHFRMKTLEGQDDYGAIRETLSRYLNHVTDEFRPDLIIIDGGKGQLSSASSVLGKDSDILLISLAKRMEEVYLPDNPESVLLPRSSSALRLLINVRDEAHRFAITYHRKKRTGRSLQSKLDDVPGVGQETKFRLLKHFGSVENIKKAAEKELTDVKGIGPKLAAQIRQSLTEKIEN
jgi:excinuclease ABC subunit C